MTDLDELFNRQPPYSEDEIVKIIAHFREARASYLSGVKPEKATGPKKKADLAALGLSKAKPSTGGLKL